MPGGFPTPIGTTTIRSISRRVLLEEAVDVYYLSSPITQRFFAQDRVVKQGGFQIEQRFIYEDWANGGSFTGPEVLNVTPSTVEVSGAWDWKEYSIAITLVQKALIQADSPYAVANYIIEQCETAKMSFRNHIYKGVWSTGANSKTINGLYQVVDTGALSSTYAGLPRATWAFTKGIVTSAVTTLTMGALTSIFSLATKGARAPTIIASTRANYSRYLALVATKERFFTNTATIEQTHANGGFVGAIFNGIPWFVDTMITPTGTEGTLFMLNEAYMKLVISQKGDFLLGDFQQPPNQWIMTALMYAALNLICTNPAVQAKMTAITS